MRWERKAVQEDMHLCVLTLDRTFFYVYQPKYITDQAFKDWEIEWLEALDPKTSSGEAVKCW